MNTEVKKSCAFTGHRLNKLEYLEDFDHPKTIELVDRIEIVIRTLIEKMGVVHFYTGMAVGIDMYAAECVIRMKSKYPNITLEAAIPCLNQEKKWSKPEQERYFKILGCCDKLTVLQKRYTKYCMMRRNAYMVDNADILFAVWDKSPGGTGNTVNYAIRLQKKGVDKQIIRLDPETLALEGINP